jgi:hypothetical protein
MKHDGGGLVRQFSADDTNLLADLAEATGGLALQALGQTEILASLTLDQGQSNTGQNRCQISRAAFAIDSAAAIPEVSVSERRSRTISPLF